MSHHHKVLLVDDDPASLFTMAAILEDDGFEVCTASSLAEAMELIDSDHIFDLAIADMNLDDGSGLELLAPFRAKHKGKSFAVLSGDAPGAAPGVDAWLEKGSDPDELVQRAKKLAQGR